MKNDDYLSHYTEMVPLNEIVRGCCSVIVQKASPQEERSGEDFCTLHIIGYLFWNIF